MKEEKEKWIEKYIPRKGIVLEVGCGNGEFIREISKKHLETFFLGIDPYISFMKEKNLKLLPMGAEEILNLEEEFDLIFTIHSLHHFRNPQKFFKDASKKLKKRGRILIWDWNKNAQTGIPERYFSIEKLSQMAKSGNLEIEISLNFGEENLLIAYRSIP